jgi:hypothetical protein
MTHLAWSDSRLLTITTVILARTLPAQSMGKKHAMPALGHKRTFCNAEAMSALPPKADKRGCLQCMRLVLAQSGQSNRRKVRAIRGSHFRIGKTPADKILASLATTLTCLDAAWPMPLMHGVEPLAETSKWDGDIDEMRESRSMADNNVAERNLFWRGLSICHVLSVKWPIRIGTCVCLPRQPRDLSFARSNDPSTWDSYERAVRRWQDGDADGIGFMLLDSGIGAADLDHCCGRDADKKRLIGANSREDQSGNTRWDDRHDPVASEQLHEQIPWIGVHWLQRTSCSLLGVLLADEPRTVSPPRWRPHDQMTVYRMSALGWIKRTSQFKDATSAKADVER